MVSPIGCLNSLPKCGNAPGNFEENDLAIYSSTTKSISKTEMLEDSV